MLRRKRETAFQWENISFTAQGWDVTENAPLSRRSYALCGGPARVLIQVKNSSELQKCAEFCYNCLAPFQVVGGLSNLLLPDEGYDGVIILNRGGSIRHNRDGENVSIQVDSGVMVGTLVRYCEEQGIAGFEWAAGLPGTIGGAVYGNAGAFGQEIGNLVSQMELLDENGTVHHRNSDGFFRYRGSLLKDGALNQVLLTVTLNGHIGDIAEICEKNRANRQKRLTTQPHGCGSLGCAFRNPAGDSAGRLIDATGLKGTRSGLAEISTVHANFITTSPGAKSADYLALLNMARESVWEKFGVPLEPEIELLDES